MKKTDFLAEFLSNTARARLLRIFLSESEGTFIIKDLAKRAALSLQAALKELRALEKLKIIRKGKPLSITLANGTNRLVTGKSKQNTWMANTSLKEFTALSRFVHEVSPMRYEAILDTLRGAGKLSTIVLSGNFMGDATRPADLLIAGDSLNGSRLAAAIKKLEPSLGREIRYAFFTIPELRYRLTVQDRLVRDTLDYPHLVLLDRAGLF